MPFRLYALALAALLAAPIQAQPARFLPASASAKIAPPAPRAFAGAFAGAFLVAEGDRVLLAGAHGDAAPGRAALTGTAYDVGALAKALTNAALLRLEAGGALSLADALGDFLPGIPHDKRALTLRDLMHESAGFGAASVVLAGPRVRAADVVAGVARVPLQHPRGTYAATDLGHVLLAAVVERASGRGFAEYVRAEVLPRAGLVETELPSETWRSADFRAEGAPDTRAYPLPAWTLGVGGVWMTAADLWRWARLVEHTPALAELGACGVAGGVCRSERGGVLVEVLHDGARRVVVLTNTPTQGEAVARDLARMTPPGALADSLR